MSFFTVPLVALVASSRGSRGLKALDSPRSFNSGVDFCMSPRGRGARKMVSKCASKCESWSNSYGSFAVMWYMIVSDGICGKMSRKSRKRLQTPPNCKWEMAWGPLPSKRLKESKAYLNFRIFSLSGWKFCCFFHPIFSLSSVQLFLLFGPLGLWRARLSWQPRLRLGVFTVLATGPPFNRVYVSGGDLQQLFQFGTIRPSSTHPRKTLESAMVPSCQWLWIMDPRSAIIGQRGRGEENLCLVSRWNRKNPKSTQNFMHFPRLSA